MKRDAKKSLLGIFNSELITKLFAKINTGAYGAVSLPSDTDAISVKNDISVTNEYEDEKSGAKTNDRNDYAPTRMKGKVKAVISTHLHMSKSNEKENPLSAFFELIFGKKEAISVTRGASTRLEDPHGTLAGVVISTAGALNGVVGNYATILLVNGGATGTVALSVDGKDFTLTYFNNSTVDDIISAIDAHADLTCVEDGMGDETTDLFVDLLASRALSSGSKLYLNGGAEKGWLYSNEDAPVKDMNLIYNKDKVGQVILGFIPDKLNIEMGDNMPSVKIEGMGRKSVLAGTALLTNAASSANKLYVGSEYKQFAYDPTAPSFIDVIDNDGLTYKSKANKITGVGVDGTGPYVQVQNTVTADVGDIVIFHEPENHNPVFAPSNGMSGSVEIDGVVIEHKRNFKFEYANNHQVFDNLAFEDSINGYAAAKMLSCKMSVELLFTKALLPLVQKLQAKEIAVVPFKVQIGNTAGETVTIFARNVSIKSPDLADKADEVTSFTIEGEVQVTPETAGQASVLFNTH